MEKQLADFQWEGTELEHEPFVTESENSEPIRSYEGLTLKTSALYCSDSGIGILVNSFDYQIFEFYFLTGASLQFLYK